MPGWIERTPEFVARRYDRLAPIYAVFEWLYLLPVFGVRRRAVTALVLEEGDRLTLLGKPDTEPWSDLEAHAGSVETRRISLLGLGDFVICSARKPDAQGRRPNAESPTLYRR